MLEIYRYNTDNITIFINIVVKCKYTTFYHIGKTLIKRIHSLIQPAANRKYFDFNVLRFEDADFC